MSRSYKKNPIVKMITKGSKREANKAVRRSKDVAHGNNYKKCYQSYNISDFRSFSSLEQFINSYKLWYVEKYGMEPDSKLVKEMEKSWYKNYLAK